MIYDVLLLMLCTFFKGLFALFCHFFKGLLVAKIQNFLLKGKKTEIISTCTVENPPIINSIFFRSIIKENDFNGKD